MACAWCHNPESIDPEPAIAFYSAKCIGCNACYAGCPTHALALSDGQRIYDSDACIHCHRCIEVCPAEALSFIGRVMSVEEVFEAVYMDRPYYISSGGGVTLSGGEPLMQADFSEALLKKCREADIDTAMESNLSLSFDLVERLLLYLNRIFVDIKTMDDDVHRQTTGISNETVLENIKKLSAYDIPLVIRTPLIPGITDNDENILQTARWIRDNTSAAYYELLNYNPFAEVKYENIGLIYTLKDKKPLHKSRVKELACIAGDQGIEVFYG